MNDRKSNFTLKEMHKDAQEYANKITEDFAAKLELQAKLLACDDEIVLKSHVMRAYRIVTNKVRETWIPELLKVIGGIFGGAALAFANEASLQSPRILWLIIYFLLTILGIFIVALGFVIESRER